ncbi:MAG: sulfite exporter TauE/SafE family protein [Alphaproteobacteria bacterium]
MDDFTLITVAGAFLLGGLVKGVLGLGLPLTSVAVMSSVLDLRIAVPLVVIPITVTNFFQAIRGGNMRAILRRYWAMLTASAIGVWAGTYAFYRVDTSFLLIALGLVVCTYTLFNLFSVRIRLSEATIPIWSPVIGAFSGVLSGTTGSLGVPIAIYLQALGLSKEMFVQAVGIQFLITGSMWMVALIEQGGLNLSNLPVSAMALIPAIAGMAAGAWLRQRMPEEQFRTALFVLLLLVGLNLIRKGFLG